MIAVGRSFITPTHRHRIAVKDSRLESLPPALAGGCLAFRREQPDLAGLQWWLQPGKKRVRNNFPTVTPHSVRKAPKRLTRRSRVPQKKEVSRQGSVVPQSLDGIDSRGSASGVERGGGCDDTTEERPAKGQPGGKHEHRL